MIPASSKRKWAMAGQKIISNERKSLLCGAEEYGPDDWNDMISGEHDVALPLLILTADATPPTAMPLRVPPLIRDKAGVRAAGEHDIDVAVAVCLKLPAPPVFPHAGIMGHLYMKMPARTPAHSIALCSRRAQ